MTPDEARAAGVLAGRAVAGTTRSVEHTHRALSSAALRLLRLAHVPRAPRLISTGVYFAVRSGGTLMGVVAGHAMARTIDPAAPPMASTPRGSRLQSALNGAVGDGLDGATRALAVAMSLRSEGRDVPCDRTCLTAAFPHATSRVVLFVHGLCHDENAWTPPPDELTQLPRASFGDQLAAETGVSTLFLRYNTGRHVSENGADLAALLDGLTEAWPVPITELTLVGHSMGGLVIRSACADAVRRGAAWPDLTGLVVTIGTPHTGAPLEQVAAATARLLEKSEVTRGVARAFHARSAGIKDLRRGYTSDAEWAECDQDLCAHDHRQDLPPLESADHLVIAATVTTDPAHPLGRAIGDILVRTDSAHGRHPGGRDIGFPADAGRVLGGITHLGLLHDPRVYEEIRSRLADPPGDPLH